MSGQQIDGPIVLFDDQPKIDLWCLGLPTRQKLDKPPRTDRTEAIANMRVIDALSESAASGAPVSLDRTESLRWLQAV